MSQFRKHKALRLSAALAYYAVLSLAPLLWIAVAVAGVVVGEEAARGQLEQQLQESLGPSGAWVVQDMVAGAAVANSKTLVSLGGGLMLLVGAAGVFGQLQDSLNEIWEVEPGTRAGILAWLRRRLLSFAMVLGIGALLLCSMVGSALILALSQNVSHIAKLPPELWALFNEILSLGVVTVLFAAIFRVLPDIDVSWHCAWRGALVAALLFAAGKFGMAWYLGRAVMASRYGNAGALVLVLIWVYYSAIILFFGAEYASACHRRVAKAG